MAAISLITRDDALHQLARRDNWPSQNRGVMVVFCIVFVVAFGLAALFLYRRIIARRAAATE
jgi:hypothetical protein